MNTQKEGLELIKIVLQYLNILHLCSVLTQFLYVVEE